VEIFAKYVDAVHLAGLMMSSLFIRLVGLRRRTFEDNWKFGIGFYRPHSQWCQTTEWNSKYRHQPAHITH